MDEGSDGGALGRQKSVAPPIADDGGSDDKDHQMSVTQPVVADDASTSAIATLHAELKELKLYALIKRAENEGIESSVIDTAYNLQDLITMIMAHAEIKNIAPKQMNVFTDPHEEKDDLIAYVAMLHALLVTDEISSLTLFIGGQISAPKNTYTEMCKMFDAFCWRHYDKCADETWKDPLMNFTVIDMAVNDLPINKSNKSNTITIVMAPLDLEHLDSATPVLNLTDADKIVFQGSLTLGETGEVQSPPFNFSQSSPAIQQLWIKRHNDNSNSIFLKAGPYGDCVVRETWMMLKATERAGINLWSPVIGFLLKVLSTFPPANMHFFKLLCVREGGMGSNPACCIAACEGIGAPITSWSDELMTLCAEIAAVDVECWNKANPGQTNDTDLFQIFCLQTYGARIMLCAHSIAGLEKRDIMAVEIAKDWKMNGTPTIAEPKQTVEIRNIMTTEEGGALNSLISSGHGPPAYDVVAAFAALAIFAGGSIEYVRTVSEDKVFCTTGGTELERCAVELEREFNRKA